MRNKPIWFVEGEKKALAILQHGRYPVAFSGVWNFRAAKDSQEEESKFIWQDLLKFKWEGRTVFLGFDADLWTNPNVRYALYELAFKLLGKDALVRFVIWPPSEGKGIDDYLNGHKEPEKVLAKLEQGACAINDDELFSEGKILTFDHKPEIIRGFIMAKPQMKQAKQEWLFLVVTKAFNLEPQTLELEIAEMQAKLFPREAIRAKENYPYFIAKEEGFLYRYTGRLRKIKDEEIEETQKLANFEANIIEEIAEDNGIEVTHHYGIAGKIKDRTLPKISVPASSFSSLNWLHQWGNQVILEAGQGTKDHVRCTIQKMSTEIRKLTHYTHTGWRMVNGVWIYLHAGGAIGQDNISVNLSQELQRYTLPAKIEDELESIKVSLSFLDIGKREITLPSWSYLYLSPLTTLLEPMPNFIKNLYGTTGNFKTTLAVLMLNHFGSFDINSLPNFSDTGNFLERKAFTLKDTLMILDDYHPDARRIDAQIKEGLAQRMIRAFSNRTGRGRLNSDTTDKGRYQPRGMLIITGEELVSLPSSLARLMVVELESGDINQGKLTELQRKAGLLPHAMFSYLSWVRENLANIVKSFPDRFADFRNKAYPENSHRKLPDQTAYLQFALEATLSWLEDKKILSSSETETLSKEGWDIFVDLANKQGERIKPEDPIKRFKGIINTLITQEKVRFEHRETDRTDILGSVDEELLGWFDDSYLYFIPDALWHSLQRYCSAEQSYFPFTRHTLFGQLKKKGIIETNDNQTACSVKIKGKPKRAIKISKEWVCPEIQ